MASNRNAAPGALAKICRIEVGLSDEESADQRTIALSDVEAKRCLEELERPNEGTVARLEDLRRRA